MADINRNKLVNAGNLQDVATRVAGKIDSVQSELSGRIDTLAGKVDGTGEGTIASQIAAAKQEALNAASAAQSAADKAQGEVDALEEKVGQLPDGKTIVGYVDEKVKAEEDRAKEEEGKLLAAINALKGDGTGSVTEQIAAAKQELQGAIDDAEELAQQGVDDAATAQAAADKAQGEVDALEVVVTQQKTDLQNAVEAEAQRADAEEKRIVGLIDAINNSETGILKKAKDYTDTEVNKAKEETADVAADLAKLAGLVGELPTGATSSTVVGYVDEKVTALVDSAPEAMDTLNELAKAIKDNKDVYDGYVAEHATAMTQMKTDLQKEIDDDVKVEANRAKEEEGKIRNEFATADAGLLSKIEALEGLVGTESVESKVNAMQQALTKFKEDQAQKDADQDSAISTAKQDAIDTAAADAKSKADKALADAKTYANEAKADAISSAAEDATTKANNALKDAKAYADQAETDAIAAAATDATTKAEAAQAAAISAAATDASTKADAAKDAAIAAAATDAKSKADAAQAAAVEAAAADATTKANNALADAKAYADQAETDAIAAAKTETEAQVGVLETKVVNTFASLDLIVHTDKKVHVTYEGATQPLGNGIEVMTDPEVEAMLKDIFGE